MNDTRIRSERCTHRDGVVLALPWDLSHVGGVNVVVRALIDEFQQRHGLAVRVLIPDWRTKGLRERCVDGRREAYGRLRAPAGDAENTLKAAFMYLATLPASLLRLGRWFRRCRVKCVNVHYPGLWAFNLVVLRLLWARAPRVVVSFHGSDLAQAGAVGPFAKQLMGWMLRCADGITACSRQLAEDVTRQFGLPAHSVTAIHNGVDGNGLQAALARSQPVSEMTDGQRWLLNVGTYLPVKGQDILLEAFARLTPGLPDVSLMLVGRDGGALAGLRQRARELGLENRVRFQNDVPHAAIPSFLAGAEVFVLPSRSEGLPLVILEAGLAGLPVVATRVGGVPEIIDSPECGSLVEPDDPDALYHALRAMLDDESRRHSMGRALRARVLAEFSWERTAEQYLAVLRGTPEEVAVS